VEIAADETVLGAKPPPPKGSVRAATENTRFD
jgi:hypothetical protein